MNKKQKKEKALLENLDRVAAGEKLRDDAELDKETKAALEISREMTSWSKSPSKEFKAELKAKVTHRVTEENKRQAARGGNFELREYLRRPAWQMTFAAVMLAIIAGIIFLIVYFLNR